MSKRLPNPRGSGQKLHDDLIATATEMLEEPQLLAAPSLRKIALATGISPSAVYTRFESGEELLQAVIDSQYEELRDEIRKAAERGSKPIEKLESVVSSYVEWGIGHPGAYQLLFESADKMPEGVVANGPGLMLMEELAGLVSQATNVTEQQSKNLTLRIWAALHGITSLRIHKKRAPWTSTSEDEARATVHAFLKL